MHMYPPYYYQSSHLVLYSVVLICPSLSLYWSTVVIGWQFATYQAAEGTATVQACAQVLNGATNIGSRTFTLHVSTAPGTAQGTNKF